MDEGLTQVKIAMAELREVMSSTAQLLALYDQQLAPYWYAKGDIEHKILRTHRRGNMREVVFDPAGVEARKPLFAELDALTVEWGPVKTDRNIVKGRLSGYERDYKRLTNELKYLERKEARHGKRDTGQKDLF